MSGPGKWMLGGEPPEPQVFGVPESDEDDDYEGWSKAELKEEAETRGLSASGNKAELAERLREDDQSDDEADEAE